MTDSPTTGCTRSFALRRGVYSGVADQTLWLLVWNRRESFGASTAWRVAVLRRLAERDCHLAELEMVADGKNDGRERPDVRDFVDQLCTGGWLTTTVIHNDVVLYTIEPTRQPDPGPGSTGQDSVLSRFTLIHRDGPRITVESPLAWARLHIRDAAGVLALLLDPASAGTAESPLADAAAQLWSDLLATRLAVPAADVEESEFRSRMWHPHDLWLHWQSRMTDDRHIGTRYGRTMWAKGRFDPVPAMPRTFLGPALALAVPDITRLRRTDPPLTAVVEDRRSIREHNDSDPITVDQIGEFLYRCARVRTAYTMDGMEYLSRPYPSGGGVYELELYPVVRKATGLDPGLYHYDSHDHQLELVRKLDHAVGRMVTTASRSTFERTVPQVLIVITARFGRLMWTYEQLAYSLILKHVGVLYHAMYLTATAMGMAACGLGGGDSTAFNEATGLDYLTESAVGEFLLGSRPAGGQDRE